AAPPPAAPPRGRARTPRTPTPTPAPEAARKAGGEVSPPTGSPDDGAESVIGDPEGALFTLCAHRAPASPE
ncbi:VOC family protein, partial [Streptomyces microflavus]